MQPHDHSTRRDFVRLAGLAAGATGLTAAAAAAQQPAAKKPAGPTVEEAKAAIKAWCDGLVAIGKEAADGKDYKAFASKFIDDTYDYTDGRVFFRPTLAAAPQAFRNTKAGALAYFVGGNPDYPNDKGFALKGWAKVWADENDKNNEIQIHGDVVVAMGNIHLQPKTGDAIVVDKTFVFRKCKDGKLRLIAHKSALPN